MTKRKTVLHYHFGLSQLFSSKESACCVGDTGDTDITWRKKWQPAPVFLPGKSHE